MNRRIIIIVIVVLGILCVCSLYLVYLIRTNTSFLSFDIPQEAVQDNNSNRSTDIEKQEDVDLATLIKKDLIIPEEINSSLRGRTLNIPQAFEISLYASNLGNTRFMDLDEADNIFVTDMKGGRVFLVKDTDGDGYAENNIVVDSNLRNPHGIDWYKSDLYVAEEHQVIVYRNIDENGKYSNKEVIIENLPNGGGHSSRTVVIGPDEKIYVVAGSSCNICEEDDERRAAIFRYAIDGGWEEMFAEGLRNTVGFVFDDEGKMWGVDNGRDRIGDEIPVEELNLIEYQKNYGWPYCHGNQINNPEYPDRSDFCKNQTQSPAFEMQAHSAPLGLTLTPDSLRYPGLENNAIIAFHGSWNRTIPTGYKIVRIDISKSDSQTINLISGWLEDDGNVWGRPVDVKFNSKGELYISDDKAGVIYKVSITSNF